MDEKAVARGRISSILQTLNRSRGHLTKLSKRPLKKTFKWILLIAAAGVLLYAGYIIYVTASFANAFETSFTKKDLIENLKKRETQIVELKMYFKSIVPKNRMVEIEFSSDSRLGRFGVSPIDTLTGNVIYPIFLEWDLRTSSKEVDSVITPMNWTQQTLKTLKEKLDNAKCIAIRSGEPCRIGFQRSGMGMYFYDLFEQPIPDSLKRFYNDNCT
jgi:hypothetical protein